MGPAFGEHLRGSRHISAPFHPDVAFEGPLGPPVRGAPALKEFLSGLFPVINSVQIIRHIVDGEWCATVFNFDTTFGVIPIMDCFRVIDRQIVSARSYYDPRPVIEGMNRLRVLRNVTDA